MPRRHRERPLTDEERAFYAGFRSMMSPDDYRRNRDSAIQQALRSVREARGAHLAAGGHEQDQIDDLIASAERSLRLIAGDL